MKSHESSEYSEFWVLLNRKLHGFL